VNAPLDMTELRARHAAAAREDAKAADEHRAALSVAREYCNNLTATVTTPSAYDYATDARHLAEMFMHAPAPTPRLKIARDLARHLVMCAFLADHLEREAADGPA
jgi:hypothetical protein